MPFDRNLFRQSCTAIVPVRAGSKGMPGKNIRPINGTPLYMYAVNQSVGFAKKCVVSTDIPQILDGATGGATYHPLRRPAELATDEAPMEAVIRHAIDSAGISGSVLLLQATSPLRSDRDIASACELYTSGRYELVLSVSRTSSAPLKYGFWSENRFTSLSDPKYCFANRQSLPALYRPNGALYIFDAAWFIKNGGFVTRSVGATLMPAERSIDVDTHADFQKIKTQLEG